MKKAEKRRLFGCIVLATQGAKMEILAQWVAAMKRAFRRSVSLLGIGVLAACCGCRHPGRSSSSPPFDTTTAASTSVNPVIMGNPVTFTATVQTTHSGQGTPTGTITFQDNGAAISSPTKLTTGTATLVTSSLWEGINNVIASYSPDDPTSFNSSNSAVLPEQVLLGNVALGNPLVPTDNSNGLGAAPAAGRFEVSPDGAATFTYPVWVPPGRRGMQPSLSIVYNSRQVNGPLGVGWSFEGFSSISRCKRDFARDDGQNLPIQFSQNDFFCLDGQRLIATGSTKGTGVGQYGAEGTIYHTEEERFIQVINGPTDSEGPCSFEVDYGEGPCWFEVDYGDGRKLFYGTTQDSRLETTASSSTSANRLRWALSEIRDAFNNNISIQYGFTDTVDSNGSYVSGCPNPSPNEQLPALISYTGTVNLSLALTLAPQRSVSFQYECRPDATTQWISGFQIGSARRLTGISLSAPSTSAAAPLVKSYHISYQQSVANGRSLLSQIQECDAEASPVCLPPTTFAYSQQSPDGFTDIDTGIQGPPGFLLGQLQVGDINGDGCDDLIYDLVTEHDFISASYLLSSCYDTIAAGGSPVFQGPAVGEPADYYQLSPHSADAPDSTVPPFIFGQNPSACPEGGSCFNELLVLDLDLDGRMDLFSHDVVNDFGSNQQSITTNVLLASSIPPSQWTPSSGLYGQDSNVWSRGPIPIYPLSPTYNSLYVGDINGDGFPDFIHLTPSGWTFRLNRGRDPICSAGDACLNVGPESALFPCPPSCPPPTLTGTFPLYMVDLYNVGTTDLILPDPSNSQMYAGFFTVGEDPTLHPINPNPNLKIGDCPFHVVCQDWFVDVNGDGLPDAISVPTHPSPDWEQNGAPLRINTGNGFALWGGFIQPDGNPLPSQNLLFFDYDGDGTQDIIYSGHDGNVHAILTGSGSDVVLKACPNGSWQFCSEGASLIPIPAIACNPQFPQACLQAFDANGDGLTDLIQTVNGTVHVYLRPGIKRDLLVSIADRGGLTSINYAPISSKTVYSTTVPPGVGNPSLTGPPAPTYVVNRGIWVVQNYSVPRAGTFGGGPVNTYTFSYQDGRRDLHGRGWLGFGVVTRTDLQTGVVTKTTYDNSMMLGSAYPYAFKPKEIDSFVVLSNSELQHESRTIYNYNSTSSTDPTGQPDGKLITVLPCEIYQGEFEGPVDNFGLIRSFDTQLDYDGIPCLQGIGKVTVGNVTKATRTTGDGYVDMVAIEYYPPNTQFNPTLYLTAIPKQLVQTSITPTPDSQSVTRTTQFVPDFSTGVVSNAIVEPDGNEALYWSTSYALDPHGVFVGFLSSDKSGQQFRSNTVQYDPLEDLFPIAITNGVGHTDRFAFDPGLGVLAAHADPNGVVEQWKYDGFGRLKQVLAPDGSNVSLTYRELTLRQLLNTIPVGIGVRTQYAGGQNVDATYDPYMNEVTRTWASFNGQAVGFVSDYNGQGLLSQRNGPCLNNEVTCPTQYTYDSLGRLTAIQHEDGAARKLQYSGLMTTHYDASGNERFTMEDQLGRVTQSVAVTTGNQQITTTFAYEPFGLLHSITDANGNVTRTAHDVRGRPQVLNDPDSGDHFYQWDCYDELVQAQDGNGFYTKYVPDGIGRIQSITNKDGTATFTWDTAPNGVGKLAKATSTDGITTTYTYWPVGQTATATWNIEGGSLRLGFSYDKVGRLKTITYPFVFGQDTFAVQRNYNAFGFLYQVIDASAGTLLWQADAENERGEITAEHFHNGVSTQRTFDLRGRVTGISTAGQGRTLQNLSYDYYPNGSLNERSNTFSLLGNKYSLEESFKFDPLDRLENIHSIGFFIPPRRSSEGNERQPRQIFDETFSYDDIGNLKQQTVNIGSGSTLTYLYGQNGAGPHAATQVNSDVYSYDPAGNQTKWQQSGGPSRSISYNAVNLPTNITVTNSNAGADPPAFSFKYDADYQRVVKQNPTGDKWIRVGGLYEGRVQNGQATNVFYVPGPAGRIVAQVQQVARQNCGPVRCPPFKHLYFNDDSLGSLQAVTDDSLSTLEQLWYEPFGQLVAANAPGTTITPTLSNVTKGFTGQFEDNDLDLIDMVGRIYDPNIGRFLSPDPLIQNPLRSESLNRYSYAWNNPLKWVDPSGFQDCGDDDDGGCEAGVPDAGSQGSSSSGVPDAGSQGSSGPGAPDNQNVGSVSANNAQSSDWAGTTASISANGSSYQWFGTNQVSVWSGFSPGTTEPATRVMVGADAGNSLFRVNTRDPRVTRATWVEGKGQYQLQVISHAGAVAGLAPPPFHTVQEWLDISRQQSSDAERLLLPPLEYESKFAAFVIGSELVAPLLYLVQPETPAPPMNPVQVSRWGRPGLEPGDWVMQGPPDWSNYLFSGKLQRGFGNQYAPPSSGETFVVPAGSLKPPSYLQGGPFDFIKFILGQRLYFP